jgi:hypothetical protein
MRVYFTDIAAAPCISFNMYYMKRSIKFKKKRLHSPNASSHSMLLFINPVDTSADGVSSAHEKKIQAVIYSFIQSMLLTFLYITFFWDPFAYTAQLLHFILAVIDIQYTFTLLFTFCHFSQTYYRNY